MKVKEGSHELINDNGEEINKINDLFLIAPTADLLEHICQMN